MGIISTFVVAFCVFMAGFLYGMEHDRNACIMKYSDMPHNQVEPFCRKLLKFEKDTK